jgi:uncharacterized RDD family membrane protein YckC
MKIKTEPKLLRRTFATIIDYGLYLGFFIWAVTTFGVPNDEGGYSLSGLKGIWVEIVWLIYFPIIESIAGQTLGKKMLGLKVVTKNGNSISFWQALRRHLVDILDFCFFGIGAFIAIKNTPNHQRLGDLWAKTIVIGGDSFECTNCRAPLTLTADEILRQKFDCPKCRASITV